MKKTNIATDLRLRIDGPGLTMRTRELMTHAADKLEKYREALEYIAKHGRPSTVADVAKEALKE